MKINRKSFLISSFYFFLASYAALSQPLKKESLSKKAYLNKILKFLNYNKDIKDQNHIIDKHLIHKDIIIINGWIFTKREVLGM